jgi:hypothetical protein
MAAAIAVLLPLAVACSSSKDIAEGDATSTPTSTTTTSPATPTAPTPTRTQPTTPSVSVPSTPPDDNGRIEGSAYSVVIPDGWTDITASVKAAQPSVDIAIGAPLSTGFRTNFNVVNSNTDPGTIEDNGSAIRHEAAAELRSITKKPVHSLPDRRIDGEVAIGQTSTFVNAGTSVTFIQYFVVHHADAYPVTMTFATENAAAAKDLLGQILSTWRWES